MRVELSQNPAKPENAAGAQEIEEKLEGLLTSLEDEIDTAPENTGAPRRTGIRVNSDQNHVDSAEADEQDKERHNTQTQTQRPNSD